LRARRARYSCDSLNLCNAAPGHYNAPPHSSGQGLQEATKEVLAGLTAREAKVLRKLRHPTRSDYLRSFLDE